MIRRYDAEEIQALQYPQIESAGLAVVKSDSATTDTPPLPNGQRSPFFDTPRRICRATTEIAQFLQSTVLQLLQTSALCAEISMRFRV